MPKLATPLKKAQEKIQQQIDAGTQLLDASYLGREDAEQKWYDYNVALLQAVFDDHSIAADYRSARSLAEVSRTMARTNDLIAGRRSAVPERPVTGAQIRVEEQLRFLESLRDRLDVYPPTTTEVASIAAHPTSYVDMSRLDELRAITSKQFDMTRIIRLAEELNAAWQAGSYHSVIMLVRATMDHIPPVFGMGTFAEVANNYPGTKSFKEAMTMLHGGARKIADLHLHTPIRAGEVLPNATQVNFGPQFDLLLAEIVRILKTAA
jgi:hypothetical protein